MLLALVLAQVVPIVAASPVPTGNDAPFAVQATAGAVVTLAGDTDTSVQPTAFLQSEGPIIVGDGLSLGRVMVDVGLSAEPGKAVNLADAATFRSAAARLGYGFVIGSSGGLETLIGGEWGFDSRLPTGGVEPVTRLSRHYGGGITLRDLTSRSSLTVMYGRDEACGPWRYGQWLLHGDVALPGRIFHLVGEASLAVGPAPPVKLPGEPQRDIFRLGVQADLEELIH